MPIKVTCPTCDKSYSVPDDRAGQTGKCKCGALMQVPDAATAPPPPPGAVTMEDEPESALQDEGVICSGCNMETRPGLTCEFCGATLGGQAPPPPPPGAAPPPHPVGDGPPPPPPPMAGDAPLMHGPRAREVGAETSIAGGARLLRLEPLSYIKNMAALSIIYMLVAMGVQLVLGAVMSGGRSLMAIPGAAAPTAIGILIMVVGSAIGAVVSLLLINFVAGRIEGFQLGFRDAVSWVSGRQVLQRISPLSAMLVSAVFTAITLFAGSLLALIVIGILGLLFGGASDLLNMAGSLGAMALVMLLIVPGLGGLWAGVVGLFQSAVYNLLASLWGGIEFDTVGTDEVRSGAGAGGAPRVCSVNSAQVGGLYALGAFLYVVILAIVSLAGASRMLPGMGMAQSAVAGYVSILVIGLGLVIAPVVGFIGGVLAGLCFNLTGKVTGGLQIEAGA